MTGDAITRDVLADYLEYINVPGRDRAERMADAAFEYARSRGLVESCEPHRDTGDLQDWEGRARAAEAKLDAIKAECRAAMGGYPLLPAVAAKELLDIIGTGPAEAAPFSATCTGQDCGTRFTDSETEESEFATRERMKKLLHADGWQVDPVLCPACQPEEKP